MRDVDRDTRPSDPLDAAFRTTRAYRECRTRLANAIAQAHRCILLIGAAGARADETLAAAVTDLAASGRAVVLVAPERFTRTDLVGGRGRGIVAIAGAQRLSRQALHVIQDHLRHAGDGVESPTILLSATNGFRDTTSLPDLSTLHFGCLVIAAASLDDADQAAFVAALAPALAGTPRSARIVRAAAGNPTLAAAYVAGRRLPLASRRGPPGWLAAPIDRPGLGVAATLIVASAAVTVAVLRLGGPEITLGPHTYGGLFATAPSPVPESLAPPSARRDPPLATGMAATGMAATGMAATGMAATGGQDPDPDAARGDDFGVAVDHETEEAAASAASMHMPRMIESRPGETLQTMYRRVYRNTGTPPSIDTVRAENPVGPAPGLSLVFPAPGDGWPQPPRHPGAHPPDG